MISGFQIYLNIQKDNRILERLCYFIYLPEEAVFSKFQNTWKSLYTYQNIQKKISFWYLFHGLFFVTVLSLGWSRIERRGIKNVLSLRGHAFVISGKGRKLAMVPWVPSYQSLNISISMQFWKFYFLRKINICDWLNFQVGIPDNCYFSVVSVSLANANEFIQNLGVKCFMKNKFHVSI